MRRMAAKKKKNKTFYGAKPTLPNQKVYLVYKLIEAEKNLIADGPFEKLDDANQAMEGYLAKGLCSWIVTYNE
jgi:hypothetical protein